MIEANRCSRRTCLRQHLFCHIDLHHPPGRSDAPDPDIDDTLALAQPPDFRRLRRRPVAPQDRACTQSGQCPRIAWWAVDRLAHIGKCCSRDRHSTQSPVCRRTRLEPAALHQGPHERKACGPAHPPQRVGHRAGASTADYRTKSVERCATAARGLAAHRSRRAAGYARRGHCGHARFDGRLKVGHCPSPGLVTIRAGALRSLRRRHDGRWRTWPSWMRQSSRAGHLHQSPHRASRPDTGAGVCGIEGSPPCAGTGRDLRHRICRRGEPREPECHVPTVEAGDGSRAG